MLVPSGSGPRRTLFLPCTISRGTMENRLSTKMVSYPTCLVTWLECRASGNSELKQVITIYHRQTPGKCFHCYLGTEGAKEQQQGFGNAQLLRAFQKL